MPIELLIGKNLPSTYYIIDNKLQAKDDQQIYGMHIYDQQTGPPPVWRDIKKFSRSFHLVT